MIITSISERIAAINARLRETDHALDLCDEQIATNQIRITADQDEALDAIDKLIAHVLIRLASVGDALAQIEAQIGDLTGSLAGPATHAIMTPGVPAPRT